MISCSLPTSLHILLSHPCFHLKAMPDGIVTPNGNQGGLPLTSASLSVDEAATTGGCELFSVKRVGCLDEGHAVEQSERVKNLDYLM